MTEQVDQHLRSGKYRSLQDFITAAIRNQLYLETQEDPQAVLGIQKTVVSDSQSSATSVTSAIQLLQLPNLNEVKTIPISNLERDQCLWGQYNRIFPTKIVTRVAANLARIDSSDTISLEDLQERSADIARNLGKEIERADERLGRKRGEIISAALPIGKGPGADKSKLRFKNQFVGYLYGKKAEGASATLKFIDFSGNSKNSTRVGITDFGLKFASLPNPVIDRQDYLAPFSSEEVTFLLDHVASQLPEEAELIRLILSSVKDGVTSPEGLNEKVRSSHAEWKKSQPITMRAGVVSRISELGLLGREKNGVKVTYKLTELGEKYLGKLGD
jgi:hypothetical protein